MRLLLQPNDPADSFRTATVFRRIGIYFFEYRKNDALEIMPSREWNKRPEDLKLGSVKQVANDFRAMIMEKYPGLKPGPSKRPWENTLDIHGGQDNKVWFSTSFVEDKWVDKTTPWNMQVKECQNDRIITII